MDTILVNKLPTRTWNRLGVNETALLWDEAGTVGGGTEVLTGRRTAGAVRRCALRPENGGDRRRGRTARHGV